MEIAIQEEQQKILHELEEAAEEKQHEMERVKMEKESAARRETMVAQYRMWQSQLKEAEEFDGAMDKYMEMKVKYMFCLTMDVLKLCHCSDYTAHLQRYLIHDGMTYEPGTSDMFDLEALEGIDTNNVEAVAQRLAGLSDAEGVKLFFGGMIESVCEGVRAYVDSIRALEQQYNFL